MAYREKLKNASGFWLLRVLFLFYAFVAATTTTAQQRQPQRQPQRQKNAYATMMYMGTPRDYEFYVATRVMIRSLVRLHVDADIVVIASLDVPLRWVQAL